MENEPIVLRTERNIMKRRIIQNPNTLLFSEIFIDSFRLTIRSLLFAFLFYMYKIMHFGMYNWFSWIGFRLGIQDILLYWFDIFILFFFHSFSFFFYWFCCSVIYIIQCFVIYNTMIEKKNQINNHPLVAKKERIILDGCMRTIHFYLSLPKKLLDRGKKAEYGKQG